MPTALLVDDEASANRRLEQMLAEHASVRVVGAARNVAEARVFIAAEAPDIVFLDMEMPGGSGLELVPDLPAGTQVIFATAYPQYAVSAFDVGAVDYLLKPIDPDRLDTAVERVLRLIEAKDDSAGEQADETHPRSGEDGTIWLPALGQRAHSQVATSEILWVEGMGNYTRIRLRGREKPIVFRLPIAKWAGQLPEEVFARLSRSLIVQARAIRTTTWKSRNETLLVFEDEGEALVVGRTAAARLRAMLQRQ